MSWQWLCLSEIKSGFIGGAARRELGGKECARSARRRARPAYPFPRIDAYGPRCTTRRRNAHGIAEYELLYPWHPWAGCLVHIHEVVEKAGREVFRCSLSWIVLASKPVASVMRLVARPVGAHSTISVP